MALDTTNDQLVGVQGGTLVTILLPKARMTPAQAIRHAAWLVAMAEAVDPDAHYAFEQTLDAVRGT